MTRENQTAISLAWVSGNDLGPRGPFESTESEAVTETSFGRASRFAFGFTEVSPDGVRKQSEVVCVRVRSAENGQILFGASHGSSDLDLPARGQFTLEIGLQIDVPPGLYLVEALVRDLDLGRRIASGPRICIRVADSRHFDGSVQMNASFRLVTLGEL